MRNNFIKVNMRSVSISVTMIFSVFILLILSTSSILAYIPEEGPGRPWPTKKLEINANSEYDLLNSIYDFFSTDGQETSHDIPVDKTPQYCVWDNFSDQNSAPSQPQTTGRYIMYRQSDYQNTLPHGCTMASAGCGPTTVANIVANLSDKTVTPLKVLEAYRQDGSYLGCDGSTMEGAEKALKNHFDLLTQVIIPEGSNPMRLDQAVPKLLPYIRTGSWIFAGADFVGGGHYFTITQINMSQNSIELIGLETAYGNRNSIPFSYKYMAKDGYPKIKKAMSVRAK